MCSSGQQMELVLPSRGESCLFGSQTGTQGCPPSQDAIASDSMSTLQSIQNLLQSQQVVNSEDEILDTIASLTNRCCHSTFSWCPSYSGVRDNELADVADNEGTTVEQEGVSQHYDSAITAIRRATKAPITGSSLYQSI